MLNNPMSFMLYWNDENILVLSVQCNYDFFMENISFMVSKRNKTEPQKKSRQGSLFLHY